MIWKDIMLTSYEQPLFNWKQTLSGIDVEKFKRQYLDPASGYVGVVRCPDREKCSPHECCGLNIRDLSSGTTACCSQRFSGPRIPVSQEDVTRYGLSHPRFHAELCRQLGLELSSTAMGDFFWELGTYKRGTGRFLPVYISYYITQAQLTEKLKDLLVDPKVQFALVLFDHSMISRPMAKILENRKCICISMQELFALNPDSTLKLLTVPEHIFNIYKEEAPVLQQTFQCESGTRWSDIHLKYKDGETISIWKRGSEAHPFSYMALNMADARTRKPNKAFNLLCEMLKIECDTLPVPAKTDPHYSELVQRKKELNTALKNFFSGVEDGDPVVYDRSTFSYRIKMQVKSLSPIL